MFEKVLSKQERNRVVDKWNSINNKIKTLCLKAETIGMVNPIFMMLIGRRSKTIRKKRWGFDGKPSGVIDVLLNLTLKKV